MTAATADLAAPPETQYRKAITAGVIGNVLEWYDFGVYGYLVPTISVLFFPSGDPTVGLLPTYAQVGVFAPALLVVVRLFQGLSAGGEWGGSTAYIVEFAPSGRRGFFGSWQLVGVGSGFLFGSLTAAMINTVLPPAIRFAWGWRLPFLFGIAVGIVGAYLRWRLSDTPKYLEIEVQGEIAAAPLSEALKKYPRETWLGFGLTVHNTAAYYMALVYMTSYMSSVLRVSQTTALWIGTACLAVFVLLLPLIGLLSDHIGRRPLLITSCIGYIVLGFPFFWLATGGYVELAAAAQLLMVLFYVPYAGASPALYAEIFPTRVRYTALSIGYNIAVAIFGGFAPFIATFLVWMTGNNYAPAAYVVAAALVTLVFLLRMRETAFAPLR